jgi:hypothetical protein
VGPAIPVAHAIRAGLTPPVTIAHIALVPAGLAAPTAAVSVTDTIVVSVADANPVGHAVPVCVLGARRIAGVLGEPAG